MPNIALFDLDGTLADYNGQLENDLSLLRSNGEQHVELSYDVELPSWYEQRVRLIKRQIGWWENLPRIEAGFLILEYAKLIGFHIHILTLAPRHIPNALGEKVVWCQKHIGNNVDFTLTRDKGGYYGRILVDDYPPYIMNWLKHRPRGLGIMPTASYNKDFKHPNVVKYDPVKVGQTGVIPGDVMKRISAQWKA